MQKMGYDKDLFSLNSRIFVCSIHSPEQITVSIGDAIQNNYNEIALGLMMKGVMEEEGVG